ncbi:MAG: GAF domain-containing sensor histidine kinase, partial [Mangrovicoccus sp.]
MTSLTDNSIAPPPAEKGPRDSVWRIAKHLAAETEIRYALGAVAGEIAELIPFTHADICLLDSPGWSASYEVGIQTRWSRKRTRIAYSPVRLILSGECETMLTANAMEDPRYIFPGAHCEPILKHKLRARVNVAMKSMGQLIGSLNISHETAGLYDAASLATAQDLANLLAPYFHALHTAERARQATHQGAAAEAREEGLRQGALELTQALEQERQRIGMDLHDQTLADLTRLLRDLSAEPAPPLPVLADKLRICIEDLRRIIDMAVPTLLDLFGFAHALRIHLERATETAGIEIAIEDQSDNAPDRLDCTTRTALFRIAQEAINNAARHSGASRIVLGVELVSAR